MAKKPSTAVAVRDPKAGALSAWEQTLMKEAEAGAARVDLPVTGRKISLRGKRFTYQNANLASPLAVIILDWEFWQTYYENDFDPDAITAPECFAHGDLPRGLVPSTNSPKRQGGYEPGDGGDKGTCEGCWAHKFGSAQRGKGWACRSGIRIAVTDPLFSSEVAYIDAPPKSHPYFIGHDKAVRAQRRRPLNAVVSLVSFVEEADWPTVQFRFDRDLEQAEHAYVMTLLAEARDLLTSEPDVSGYGQAPSTPVKGPTRQAVNRPTPPTTPPTKKFAGARK